MHFSPSFIVAALVARAAADFQIYYENQNQADPNPDNGAGTISSTSILMMDTEPSCGDVDSKYARLSVVGDASSAGYARCEGCASGDVTELEMNASGWGHFTIYSNGGFTLDPADGSRTRGSCVPDDGDTYDCALPFAQAHGQRLFLCTSDLGGFEAR